MRLIEPAAYPAVRPALAAMYFHQAVAALVAGRVPGSVWTDDPAQPNLAVAQVKQRLFVGDCARPGDVERVRALLEVQVLPEAESTGQDGVVVHAPADIWAAGLEAALRDLLPDQGARQYYERSVPPTAEPAPLPADFSLRAADAALLADPQVAGLEALREEMCSERPSVEAFLAESFGVVALAGGELAGWCLSEYNLGDRCEVGIATLPPYQRRGLAVALTQALLATAAQQGIHTLGWHCWTHNTASAATARRAGFHLVTEEVVRLRLFR